ncbi:MAG: response regulator [Lutibacter sp.]
MKNRNSETGKEDLINSLKILIVEDDSTSELMLSLLVEKYCKECLTAKNGQEAIQICKDNPNIDLILMDIKMLGMNGYEATKIIRQFNKDVIILAQTAYALLGDREKAIESGCNDYISKPISQTEFYKIFKKFFKNRIKVS